MNTDKSRNLPLAKRGMSFETFMWVFTRLSGLAIYGLVIIGLIGVLIMGASNQMNFVEVMRWAFNPNIHHVHGTSIADLTAWESPFWKIMASALLLVTASHGVHGLVVIADDYIVQEQGRKFTRLLSVLSVSLISIIGLYMIWTA
jgi:succinate dehydrogenase hydrophobic anchor subunit